MLINWIFSGKKAQRFSFVLLRIWAGVFALLCFYRIKQENIQHAAKKGAFIYVCNHSSYLDAIAVVLTAPQAFKPLGKIEMAKVPVFGAMYKHLVVMVDRGSKESRSQSVETLKTELDGGQSLFIFPEGTMNRTGEVLQDFYDGAFRIAIETQTPIAPMVLLNAGNLLHPKRLLAIKPGSMTMVFLPVVEVKGLGPDDLPALKARVRGMMETAILAARS